jgi:hypothetical protein
MYRYPILVFIHSILFAEGPGFPLALFLIYFLIPLCMILVRRFLRSFTHAELLLLRALRFLYLSYRRMKLFFQDGRFVLGIYLGLGSRYLALKLLQQSLILGTVNSE